MVRKNLMLVVCALFVFSMSVSAYAMPNPYDVYLNAVNAAEKAGDWAKLVSASRTFINYAKLQGGHKNDKDILTVYDKFVKGYDKQGYYNAAGNIVREKNTWKPDSSNIDKVMAFEQKDMQQREYFQKTLAFHNERVSFKSKILEFAQEKEKLVKALLDKKEITKEELASLSASLKELTGQIASVTKDLVAMRDKALKELAVFEKAGIIFTAAQQTVVDTKARLATEIQTKINAAEKAAREGLVKITEKYQFSWDGLEELLTKMQGLQTKIMDLQKQIMDLMGKSPLSDEDKKILMGLKADLDKLNAEHDQLMIDIEKAFMDTTVFNKLSIDQQKKYLEIFRVIREAAGVINKNDKVIEDFIKKMNFKYGDLNSDGKIDARDTGLLINMIINRKYNKAADLDGSGKVDWSDYYLINEMVRGTRKTAPADEANLKGDFNGDGILNQADLDFIIRMYFNPALYAGTAYKKIADLTGDGKIDINDIVKLVNAINNPPVQPCDDTASGTAKNVATDNSSGNATGGTSNAATGTGTSAGNLNSGF
ncbi:MAG: hypothetical protein HQM10_21780 [Candidatus Riflebacteria bacterium]|nr:hypothetical protein [Candidatus Riflebacteria bacterium]